jgi:hypothetical protein
VESVSLESLIQCPEDVEFKEGKRQTVYQMLQYLPMYVLHFGLGLNGVHYISTWSLSVV